MPRMEFSTEEVEGIPQDAAYDGVVNTTQQLHEVRFKNFTVHHGRFRGDHGKVVIHFTDVRRAGPEAFQGMLRKFFVSTFFTAYVTFEDDVGVGNTIPRGKPGSNRRTAPGVEIHSVYWISDLPEDFLGWVRRQVHRLDTEVETYKA